MVQQIRLFEGNALALALADSFTAADAALIEQLFEEKLSAGHTPINLLVKVKDLSILRHMDFKAFLQGEIWGMKHFSKIGRCAIVADSALMKSIVTVENKVLHLANAAFEEKYFDTEQLAEALQFINPEA